MKFNICLIQPPDYIHTGAFLELIELIRLGLQDLGHAVAVSENRVAGDARNIVVGFHLLAPAAAKGLPPSTVLLNTEQVFDDHSMWNAIIMGFAAQFEVWDYSARNIERFNRAGITNARLFQIGYHPRLHRIASDPRQDIDVLFYGSMNERRRAVIDALKAAGLNVQAVFGLYGPARDALISRAKVVLNLHALPSHIFEVVRVFYLMTNAKAVVAEVGPSTSIPDGYADGVFASTYEDLVASCQKLVADHDLRAQIEQRALAAIQRLPQGPLLAPLLGQAAPA